MALYEKTADGLRCPLHDVRFADGASCSRCDAVRAIVVQDTSKEADSIALDAEILKDAEADIGFAKYLHKVARERIEDGNPNDWNAAAKLIAEGTKLKYRALEEKNRISGRAHSRYLVEHEKEIKGLTKRKGN